MWEDGGRDGGSNSVRERVGKGERERETLRERKV